MFQLKKNRFFVKGMKLLFFDLCIKLSIKLFIYSLPKNITQVIAENGNNLIFDQSFRVI